MPKLLSIQVGKPKDHGADSISKKGWTSGIFKEQVTGSVRLNPLNLEGDGQADLQAHGGPFRAVLGYSAEHYPVWREELNMPDLPYGAFGENFTISGLDDETVCLGDVYALGDVRLQVAQPRRPCYKLARRWQIKDLTARVELRQWGGWYHRVLQTGMVEAGMEIELLERPYPEFPMTYVNALLSKDIDEPEDVARLADVEVLSTMWREIFARYVAEREEA